MIPIRKIFLLTLIFCLTTVYGTAEEIASVHIDQVQVNYPSAKLYFNILDSQGHPEPDTIPNDFTTIIGSSRASIKEIQPFAASGQGVAYIFLIDTSTAFTHEDFAQIKEIYTSILNKMSANDKASVITFGPEVSILQSFTANKEALKNQIAALSPTENHVYLLQGMIKALQTAHSKDSGLPSRRAVIVVSSGQNDDDSQAKQQEILQLLRLERLPIYGVGYCNAASKDRQMHLDVLGEWVRYSGGAYYQSQSAKLSDIYTDIYKNSRSGFVAYLTCPPLDNGPGLYKIQLALKNGDKLFTDTVETHIIPKDLSTDSQTPAPIAAPPKGQPPLQLFILPAFAIILFIGWVLYKPKKKSATADFSSPTKELSYPSVQHSATTERDITPTASRYCPPTVKHPSPQSLNLLLTRQNRPFETFSIYLTDSITIGSGMIDHLLLAHDNDISVTHCKLSQENGKLYITDLASANGTYVNGILLKQRIQLHDADVLRIGKTELLVTF